MMKILLRHGWDLDLEGGWQYSIGTDGEEVLQKAIRVGNKAIARLFVEHVVSINHANQSLDAVLTARKYGRQQTRQMLLSMGGHDADPATSIYSAHFANGHCPLRQELSEDELFYN